MDTIGWYIATMHSILGHDTTARVIGAAPGDRADCVICQYDRNPTAENRPAVERALAAGRAGAEQ
jgi:hypothetical protein